MRFVGLAFGLGLTAALATPAVAQLTYVDQNRRVESFADTNPPPTQTTGQTSQQATDFGPFNGSVNATYYWGQPGFDYGGHGRATQNSTLAPSGVSAAGTIDVSGDTVFSGARSVVETTFDLASDSPYSLVTSYQHNDDWNGPGPESVVEIRRVEAGGDVVVLHREVDFGLPADSDLSFQRSDSGTLTAGRYRLSLLFESSFNDNGNTMQWSYDSRLAVPEPATAALLLSAAPLLLLRRRR